MAADWPNLDSLAIRMNDVFLSRLYPVEVSGLVLALVWCLAVQTVHTHSEPSPDPSLPDDDRELARRCSSTPARVRKAREAIADVFESSGGKLRLRDASMIVHIRPSRAAIPAATRSLVYTRDAGRCIYCGSTDGPFHIDHVFPRSRGGSDDVSNLALACAPCNLRKGDRTIAEWMAQ